MLTLVSRTLVQYFFSLSVNRKWWKSIFAGTDSCLCSDWCLFLPACGFANNSMLCFNRCLLSYFFQVTEILKMCKANRKLSDMIAHLARDPFHSRLTNTQLIIIVKMSIKQQIWLQRWMKTHYIISVCKFDSILTKTVGETMIFMNCGGIDRHPDAV